MKKQCGFLLLYVVVAVLLLPLLLTILCGGLGQELPQEAQVLYGLADLAPLDTELEEYVAGVVAAGISAATTHFKYSLISISLTQSSSDTYTLTVPLSIGLCPSPLPPINQTIASGKSNVIKMIITTTKSIFFTPKSPF